jgi:hypothetical protein
VIRAVLDTNLFVSMAIRPGGTPDQIRLAWQDGRFTLLASPPLLAEIQRVLAYPRLPVLIRISREEEGDLLRLLVEETEKTAGSLEVDRELIPPGSARVTGQRLRPLTASRRRNRVPPTIPVHPSREAAMSLFRVSGRALGALVGVADGRRGRLLVLASLALAFLAAPLAAGAQQPPKIPRIGYLGAFTPSAGAPLLEAFRQGLRELGYVEGQTISIDRAIPFTQVTPAPSFPLPRRGEEG